MPGIRRVLAFCLVVCSVVAPGCGTSELVDDASASETGAQLFDAMGAYRRPITTGSKLAQGYFDQGLTWMFAFNHDEAIRSFSRAAELDPDGAMPWWGVALCEGPNYNDSEMTEERSTAAWAALEQAVARIDNTSPVERALIEALQKRYANPWPEDRSALEDAYADAMAEVWAAYPDDSDVGMLFAEALMIRTPWKLYSVDQQPAENTAEIVEVLERVMKLDPSNPGARHLYIHAVEPSENPDRALVAADWLSNAVPASGHLLHMPSHVYVKTGRWERSIEQNRRAMESDVVYRDRSPEQQIQWIYMTHNAHMLAYSAMMVGREQEAMEAARAMWTAIPEEVLPGVGPFVDRWMCSIYDVQKRFGRWDDLLAEEGPPDYLPITRATWRAARAVAYAAKQEFTYAELEYEQFQEAVKAIPEDVMWGRDSAIKVLAVSDYFVQGEIALQQGDLELAIAMLEKSAAAEDTLGYGEPPQWLQPVRHTLGAVYIVAERYEDAERAYRDDLGKWRDNGWSLYGLGRSLELQGRTAEAEQVQDSYRQVWAKADAPTTTSCKCIPTT